MPDLVKSGAQKIQLLSCILLFSVGLTSCQCTKGTDTSGTAQELVSSTSLPETRQIATAVVTAPAIPPSPSAYPAPPIPVSDSARQLTSMESEKIWWSEDSHALFFSTVTQTWMIDLSGNVIQPAPDAQDPRDRARIRALTLVDPLIPVEASSISVSPSGDKVIFSYPTTPVGGTVEACDGEGCTSVPANEIWLIDVENGQLTPLQVKGEMIAMEVSFLWSDDETHVLIVELPCTWSEFYLWVADLSSSRVFSMGARDGPTLYWSISPNGKFIVYETGKGLSCGDTYLWDTDSQRKIPLQDVPCGLETGYFWLADNMLAFSEKVGQEVIFWAYDVTTFERREIASSAALPTANCVSILAPDKHKIAVVPFSDISAGIWLVNLEQ